MKIAYATYIDNQEVIGYPIRFILSEHPQIKVFCSDDHEKEILKQEGIDAEPIWIKIHSPEDIAHAQNHCLNLLFSQDNDYVVWVQADMYMTPEVANIVKRVCVPGNESAVYGVTVRHLRLFHISTINNWGVTIVGKNCPDRFYSDGAHVGSAGNPAIGGPDAVIDIGYLSITQYSNHLRQHAKTWSSDNHNYLLPDEEFVRDVIDYNKRSVGLYEFIREDSIYWPLVEKMGMVEEYKKVKQILNIL